MHRLFLALWPDAMVRNAVREAVATLQQAHAPGGRAVHPDRYHITLQFFGDFPVVDAGWHGAVREACARVRAARFVLPLDHSGRFGTVGWLGPARTPALLAQLWDALDAALADAGVERRRHARFVPHLTVLRDMRRPWPASPLPRIDWPVADWVLIDSRHGEGPARYEVLDRWPLE
ncbi:MAG TPA: RNA 2',3'-cyclic phosphodiesterase [Lysobacter sp.]|nr:RNA 2',3'-cyclic phosphodiesterase [Lysobacter sp.]